MTEEELKSPIRNNYKTMKPEIKLRGEINIRQPKRAHYGFKCNGDCKNCKEYNCPMNPRRKKK